MPIYTDPRAHTREEISRMVDLLGSFWLDDQQVINAVAHDHEDSVEVLLTLEGGAQRRLVFLVKREERPSLALKGQVPLQSRGEVG